MRVFLAVLYAIGLCLAVVGGQSFCHTGKPYSYVRHHEGSALRFFDCSPKLLRNDSLQMLDALLEPMTSLPARWHWSRAITSLERQLPFEIRLRLFQHDVALLQKFLRLKSTAPEEYERLVNEHDKFLNEKIRRDHASLMANLTEAKALMKNLTVLQHRFELRKKLITKTGGFKLLNSARDLKSELDSALNKAHGFVMAMANLAQRAKLNHVIQVHRDFDEDTWLETFQQTTQNKPPAGNVTLAHARTEHEMAMLALANATFFAGKTRNQSARIDDFFSRLSSEHYVVFCDNVGHSVHKTRRLLTKVRLRGTTQKQDAILRSVDTAIDSMDKMFTSLAAQGRQLREAKQYLQVCPLNRQRLRTTMSEIQSRESLVKQKTNAISRTLPRMRRSRRRVQSAVKQQLPLIQDAVTNTRILTRSLTLAKPFRKVLSDRSDMLTLAKQAAGVEEDVANTLLEASRLLNARATPELSSIQRRRQERRKRLREVLQIYRRLLLTAGESTNERWQPSGAHNWPDVGEKWSYPSYDVELPSTSGLVNKPLYGSMMQSYSDEIYETFATSMPSRRLLSIVEDGLPELEEGGTGPNRKTPFDDTDVLVVTKRVTSLTTPLSSSSDSILPHTESDVEDVHENAQSAHNSVGLSFSASPGFDENSSSDDISSDTAHSDDGVSSTISTTASYNSTGSDKKSMFTTAVEFVKTSIKSIWSIPSWGAEKKNSTDELLSTDDMKVKDNADNNEAELIAVPTTLIDAGSAAEEEIDSDSSGSAASSGSGNEDEEKEAISSGDSATKLVSTTTETEHAVQVQNDDKIISDKSARRRLLWFGVFRGESDTAAKTTTSTTTSTTTTTTEPTTVKVVTKSTELPTVHSSGDEYSGEMGFPGVKVNVDNWGVSSREPETSGDDEGKTKLVTSGSSFSDVTTTAAATTTTTTETPTTTVKKTTDILTTITPAPDVIEVVKKTRKEIIQVGRINEGIQKSGEKLRVIAKEIQKELDVQAGKIETTTKALRRTDISTIIPATVVPKLNRLKVQENARRMTDIAASIGKFSDKVDELMALLSENSKFLNKSKIQSVAGDVMEKIHSSDQLEYKYAQCEQRLHKAIAARERQQRKLDEQINAKTRMISVTTQMLANNQKTALINNTQAYRSSFLVAWNNKKGDILSFEVKTRSENGLLVRLYNPLPKDVARANAKAEKRELDVRLAKGMPYLIWKVNGNQRSLAMTFPINTGYWHTIQLKINGTKLQLLAFLTERPDEKQFATTNFKLDSNIVRTPLQLQLGQTLKASKARVQSFNACLSNIQLNEYHIPFWLARNSANRSPPSCSDEHAVGKFRRSPSPFAERLRVQRAHVHRHESLASQTKLSARGARTPILAAEINVRPNAKSRLEHGSAWRRQVQPNGHRKTQPNSRAARPITERPRVSWPTTPLRANHKQSESITAAPPKNNTFSATIITTASHGTIFLYQSALDAMTTLRLRSGVLVLEGFSGRKVFRKVCHKYLDNGQFHRIVIRSSTPVSTIHVDCEPCTESKMAILPSSSSEQFKARLLLKGRHDRLRLPLRQLPDQGKELTRFQGYIGHVFFNGRPIRQPPMPTSIGINRQAKTTCKELNDSIRAIIRRK